MPALIAYIDADQRFRFNNSTHEKWYGVPRNAFQGRSVREALGEEYYATLEPHLRKALAGEKLAFQNKLIRCNETRFLDVRYVPDFGAEGKVAGVYVMANDISQLKQTEQAMRESQAQLSNVIASAMDAIITLDAGQNIVLFNKAAESMFGWEIDDMRGKNIDELIPERYRPSHSKYLAAFRSAADNRTGEMRESRKGYGLRKDGSEFPVDGSISHMSVDGVSHLTLILRDITERMIATKALTKLAHHDALTGLPNRTLFNDRLARALLRRKRARNLMALMYLDIDLFKSINDSLGHAAGDELLKGFADRLKYCARATDTVSRLGGDEFVILLEELHRPEDGYMIAEKIIDAMQEDFKIGTRSLRVTTSIGIAFADGIDIAAEDLLDRADAALYEAKRAGRNVFRAAAPVLTEVLGLPPPRRTAAQITAARAGA